MPSDVILEARQVRKAFGGVLAVNDVDFKVAPDEILAIIGPNGAGKTTLFNLISGIHQLDRGTLHFRGRQISHLKPFQIAASGIARTFQNLQIFGNMTVLENVMVGRHVRSHTGLLEAALRLPRARREDQAIRETALKTLDQVGLADRADDPADSLPFGQQRLLEIARALATEPALLMLDEPGAGLSPPEVERLDRRIRRICESGVTILLVEHDMELVMGIADRVVVLDFGQKIAEGTPEEVQASPAVLGAYLGTDWGTMNDE